MPREFGLKDARDEIVSLDEAYKAAVHAYRVARDLPLVQDPSVWSQEEDNFIIDLSWIILLAPSGSSLDSLIKNEKNQDARLGLQGICDSFGVLKTFSYCVSNK